MSAWWWTAVVVLLAGAGGLAWYELRPDWRIVTAYSAYWPRKDDDEQAGSERGQDHVRLPATGEPDGHSYAADRSDSGGGGQAIQVRVDAPLPPEPTDGDAYAAELHAIAQAAAADEWRYDSLAVLLQPPRWMTKCGYSGEDILRFYLPHADYMAELDRAHRAWLERWGADQAAWKARQLRGIRRYRGLGAAA